MNAKQKGIKVHNAVGSALSNVKSGLVWVGRKTKAGAVATKEFTSGVVLGDRDIAAEQRQLAVEKAERMQLDPDSTLYHNLVSDDDRR